MQKVILQEGADLSTIGEIDYEWDFDDEEYQEWLQEEELNNSQENMMEYINYNVTFDLSYYDNETFHFMQGETMSYDDIVDEYGEKIAQRMLSDCLKNGSGKIETYELYEDETYDINNPEELNTIAVKLLQHGGYYRDCRGFILTNGQVVYTPQEHNQCSIIDGVKGTFHFIQLGNIRVLQNSIDLSQPPTPEQRDVLRKVISCYSDDVLYLDIMAKGTEVGAQYQNPNWRQVLADIDRYFREGIKPQGGYNMHESKSLIKEAVDENYVVCYWGCPDEVLYENSETLGTKQLYYDDYGYTFGIWDGTLVCGNDNDETSCLCHDDLIMYHVIYHGWDDIMPVREVNSDAYDWDALCNTQVDYYDDEDYPCYHDEDGELLPEYQKSYGDLLKELGEPFARGRIMYDFDKGISFISFWEEPAVEEVQLIAREYGNLAKSAYWVAFNRQEDAEEYFKEYKPFTLTDWLNDNTQIPKIEKDEEQFIDHLAPPDKKHEQLRGWMDMHNAVMHKKLAMYDRNGNYKGDMPLAQYHSLIYQENVLREPKNSLNESVNNTITIDGWADGFDLILPSGEKVRYDHDDANAYPIIMVDDKIYYGEESATHKATIVQAWGYENYTAFMRANPGFATRELKYKREKEELFKKHDVVEARMWTKAKSNEYPYSILFFWGKQNEPDGQYKERVNEIANHFGISTNNLAIAMVSDMFSGDENIKLFNDWQGNVNQMSQEEEQENAIHNLPPDQKHEKLRGWMDMHNKVMYDKLAYRDHDGNIRTDKEPMTLAQYHSIIYQESKASQKTLY